MANGFYHPAPKSAPKITIDVLFVDEAIKTIEDEAEKVRREVRELIKAETEIVFQITLNTVPVRRGTLKRSLFKRILHGGMIGRIAARYARVHGDDIGPHAHLVEYGTWKTLPHPFMVPALESRRAAIKRETKRIADGH